jgi:DNA-binding CsgD family transcriptional regulator
MEPLPASRNDLPPVVVIARDATRRHAIVEMAAYAGLAVVKADPAWGPESDQDTVYVVDSPQAVAGLDGPAVILGGEPGPLPAPGLAARAYLGVAPSPEQLAAAVIAVEAGLSAVAARTLSSPEARLEELTAREREVLRLLSDGLSNRAIGAELGISENTAKFHVAAILAKLGAQTRAEAVMTAVRQGLLPL